MLPMNKTFTLENLLLYAYGDITESKEKQTIGHAIRNDSTLYEEYLQITDVRQMIENSFTDPSDQVINRIISYSKARAEVDRSEPELRLVIQN
jgi:uncharacterized cupin superfamily protein